MLHLALTTCASCEATPANRLPACLRDFLLRLPHNSPAHAALVNRGTHSAFAKLEQQLPLPGAALQQRLKRTLSALAHWCPLFAECSFLPGVVFPFAKMFKADSESCFELVATLLANYSQGWFETFPNPPVGLIKRLQMVVAQHDAQLGAHLAQHMTVFVKHCWATMSTLMTDALGKQVGVAVGLLLLLLLCTWCCSSAAVSMLWR